MTVGAGKPKVIQRRPSPKVRITYEVEFLSGFKTIELPFVMGVMAGLSGESESREARKPVSERDFIEVDAVCFDEFMERLAPRVKARVHKRLPTMEGEPAEAELEVDLTFRSMHDFAPDRIAEQVPALAELLQGRCQLIDFLGYLEGKRDPWKQTPQRFSSQHPQGQVAAAATTTVKSEELEPDFCALADESRFNALWRRLGLDLQSNSAGTQELQALLQNRARASLEDTEQVSVSSNVFGLINSLLENVDRFLSAQINEIMHSEDVRKIEGTWRGLHYLLNNTETDQKLKIRVMNITKDDLADTLEDFEGRKWDQSPVFKKAYSDEYSMFGGEPFGALIGAYEFSHHPRDVSMLRSLSRICAAAHSPFIAAVSPALFNLESWQELPPPWDLQQIMSTADYASWQSLRESEDCRYIGLTMPRILARLPYGAASVPVNGFPFEEEVDGKHDQYVWMNAAFAMGVNINRSHKLFGWGTQIRGVESGGTVINLPVHNFPTDDGSAAMKCPTEFGIVNERREAELAKLGLISILNRKNSDLAAFFGAHSLQDASARAGRLVDPDAQANERLSANLPYLFPVCRFAHYLKAIARDKIGTFKDRADMQSCLNEWIASYVLANAATANQDAMARQPLTWAEVQIDSVEARPGYCVARFYLRPHYQLEGINASLRLVSELPQLVPPRM
jgi:type VI secretion system protein ImpC